MLVYNIHNCLLKKYVKLLGKMFQYRFKIGSTQVLATM